MMHIRSLAEKRMGKEHFDKFDLAIFAQKTFVMYGGYDAKVKLICSNNLVGVILDRFSRNVTIVPVDNERFRVTVTVSISPQFFGWISGLGEGVQIEGPEKVKNEYKEFISNILKKY